MRKGMNIMAEKKDMETLGKKDVDELKKRASVMEEREKRMMAEERRANKSKARRTEAWQSLAKAKAYHDRVTVTKAEENPTESSAASQTAGKGERLTKNSPAKKQGTLLGRILGED